MTKASKEGKGPSPINYLIKARPVILELKDSRGRSCWKLELEGKKGFNQFGRSFPGN